MRPHFVRARDAIIQRRDASELRVRCEGNICSIDRIERSTPCHEGASPLHCKVLLQGHYELIIGRNGELPPVQRAR